jgi:hypothetical protein
MYIWVVLATFLAMIAAYFLPVREDMRNQVDIAVAQAKLVQFAVKQRAAEEYIKERTYPFYGDAISGKVNYHTGVVDMSKCGASYTSSCLPTGFVNDESYQTVVYCMNAARTALRTGDTDCQATADTSRVIITYGPVPSKWQQHSEDGDVVRPTADFMLAMRDFFGDKEKIGYTTVIGSGKIGIVNYEGTVFEIPTPIATDTKRWGIKSCVDDYGVCLAYMS